MGLSAGIGELVFARLNKVAKLPQCGYAAGQAVCNAVLEVMGYGSYAGPYRDVDLFFRAEEGHEPEEIISQTRSWSSALVGLLTRRGDARTDYPSECIVQEPGWDHDYDTLCFQSRRTHRIATSWRVGKVNCLFVAAYSDSWTRRDLLAGMDLNCAQVGLDLATKELFFTEDFVRFVGSKDIRIVNMEAPASALLRCLAKREDMTGTTVDVDRLITEVKLASLKQMTWGQSDQPWSYDIDRFEVPAKYEWVISKFWDELQPHFTRETGTSRRGESRERLRPKVLPDEVQLTVLERFKVVRGIYLTSWRVCSAALRGEISPGKSLVLERLASAPEVTCLGDAVALYGMAFVSQHDTPEDVDRLIDFCMRRRGVGVHRFKRMQQWVAAANLVEHAEERHGTWISSAMHQRSDANLRRARSQGGSALDSLTIDFVDWRGGECVLVSTQDLDERIGSVKAMLDVPVRRELSWADSVGEMVAVKVLRTPREFFEADFQFSTEEGWSELQRVADQPRLFVVTVRGEPFLVQCSDDGKIVRQRGCGPSERMVGPLLLGKNIRELGDLVETQ